MMPVNMPWVSSVPMPPLSEGRHSRRPKPSPLATSLPPLPGRRPASRLPLTAYRLRLFLLSLLIFATGFGFTRSCAAASFSTILTNGPSSNRLNVVFLSEGYQNSELGQFLIDATNTIRGMLAVDPFQEYSNYFNAFAISVASTQSGSDYPDINLYVDTYFNSSHYLGDPTYLTIPADSTGEGKVTSLLNTYMPQYDLAVVLVNDRNNWGGSGGKYVVVTPVDPNVPSEAVLLITHECGHTLANLGDEYPYDWSGGDNTELANTTTQTNRNLIKWKAWISTNTPIPTPPTYDYISTVGLFEGANYHATGWYRPMLNCRMQSLGDIPFCNVCREALVLSFYQTNRARPLDGFAPATTNLIVTTNAAQTFTVKPQQPTTHSLGVQWYTNNALVTGATATNFSILPLALGNGTNTVKAVLTDSTLISGSKWVLTDTNSLLKQTNTWTVKVTVTNLNLSAPRWLNTNRFRLTVTGYAPQGFAIQASTNLTNISGWTTLATNSLTNRFDYTNNTGSTNFKWRFFRARTPP